jgi:2'-5' RNA ligase
MFVALDLPDGAREELARWRDGLVGGRSELRPVAAGQLHLTLVFLGWQDESAAEAIAGTAFGAASGLRTPLLVPGAVRSIPPRRPRLFALDLQDEDGRAAALQGAVSDALETERFYKPEKRPFWAHLTLARVKRGARAEPLDAASPPLGPIEPAALTLYRSTLRPQGALYEPLARRGLPV